jgi:hypothetical protein
MQSERKKAVPEPNEDQDARIRRKWTEDVIEAEDDPSANEPREHIDRQDE